MTRRRYFTGNLLAVGLWLASVVLVTLIFGQPFAMIYGTVSGYVLGRGWFPYWRHAYEASNRPPVVWGAAEIKIYNEGVQQRDVQ